MSEPTLKTLAYAWSNMDRDTLEDAGIMKRGQVGGGDWKRFNDDPMTFILKLPDDKIRTLTELLMPSTPTT